MNTRHIGSAVAVAGIIVLLLVYTYYQREEAAVQHYVDEHGTCYLSDGTCLHDTSKLPYAAGFAAGFFLVGTGIYVFMDRSREALAAHQEAVSRALMQAKKEDRLKDEWKAYLAGFSEDERKVLEAVKAQDGVLQSTLRYRTAMSKSSLSLLLKSMEDKGTITRQEKGKTKQVFLVKKF